MKPSGWVAIFVLVGAVAGCGGGDDQMMMQSSGPLVLELGFYPNPGTTPCTGPTTMNLHFYVQGANAGDEYVVMLAGTAVPAMIDEPLPASLTVDKAYPIPMGSGTWKATVVSIAGQPAMTIPGGHLTQESSAQCM